MVKILTSSPELPPSASFSQPGGWSDAFPSQPATAEWRTASPSWTPAPASPSPWPSVTPPPARDTEKTELSAQVGDSQRSWAAGNTWANNIEDTYVGNPALPLYHTHTAGKELHLSRLLLIVFTSGQKELHFLFDKCKGISSRSNTLPQTTPLKELTWK